MTTPVDPERRSRIAIYIVASLVVLGLFVGGLIAFNSGTANAVAQQKADELVVGLQSQGLRAPSTEQITRVLGDDGGAVCTNPNNALTRATVHHQLTNGAGGPGLRPIIADRRVIQGEAEIIKVYCPDKLANFQEYVDNLKAAVVVKV